MPYRVGVSKRYNPSMNGREFTRRARRYARRTGQRFYRDTQRGKGSHVTIYIGDRDTIVKYGEIQPPMLFSMLRQLGIDPKEF